MDLIGQLSSQFGMSSSQAEGLAGSVLGLVQKALGAKFGEGATQQLQTQVPELSQWKGQAQAQEGTPGGLGGLLSGASGGMVGAAMGALGGGGGGSDLVALTGMLGKFGINSESVTALLPIVFRFLQSRLSPELLGQVSQALPVLNGGGDKQGPSGLGGGLKGIFGG